MVHQHFKLIDVFTVLDNIILGAETTRLGFLQKKEARAKVQALSEKYGLKVDLDAKVEDITDTEELMDAAAYEAFCTEEG